MSKKNIITQKSFDKLIKRCPQIFNSDFLLKLKKRHKLRKDRFKLFYNRFKFAYKEGDTFNYNDAKNNIFMGEANAWEIKHFFKILEKKKIIEKIRRRDKNLIMRLFHFFIG